MLVHAYPTTLVSRAKALVGGRCDDDCQGTALALAELDAAVSDMIGDRPVERVVASGHPGRALLAAAASADLLIVGRHGSGGGWHDTLGSISRYCVTHISVPTIVVPTDWKRRPTTQIIVGFDGSDNAAAAVEWAVRLAGPDVHVCVLIAVELAPWLTPELVRARLPDELADEEERLLRSLAEIEVEPIEHVVVIRSARVALLDAAAEADLVVVGQRGAGSLAPMLGGSVSTWMLDAAPAPVAVIPTAGDGRQPVAQ